MRTPNSVASPNDSICSALDGDIEFSSKPGGKADRAEIDSIRGLEKRHDFTEKSTLYKLESKQQYSRYSLLEIPRDYGGSGGKDVHTDPSGRGSRHSFGRNHKYADASSWRQLPGAKGQDQQERARSKPERPGEQSHLTCPKGQETTMLTSIPGISADRNCARDKFPPNVGKPMSVSSGSMSWLLEDDADFSYEPSFTDAISNRDDRKNNGDPKIEPSVGNSVYLLDYGQVSILDRRSSPNDDEPGHHIKDENLKSESGARNLTIFITHSMVQMIAGNIGCVENDLSCSGSLGGTNLAPDDLLSPKNVDTYGSTCNDKPPCVSIENLFDKNIDIKSPPFPLTKFLTSKSRTTTVVLKNFIVGGGPSKDSPIPADHCENKENSLHHFIKGYSYFNKNQQLPTNRGSNTGDHTPKINGLAETIPFKC